MGAKLHVKDLGFADLMRRAKEIKESRVHVGVLADGKGAEREEGSDLTVAEIATILEFGTNDGHIPARPALRSTFDAKREELAKMGEKLIDAVLEGKMEVAQALNLMGARLANDVKNTITSGEGVPPPNAPSTVRSKGSSRPWVDTGRVLNAISWEVQTGEHKGEHEK